MQIQEKKQEQEQEQEQEHYLGHLEQVNKQQKVRATEDIYNENGVLLVAKGTEVDSRVTQQLIKHKLSQPLDHVIEVENRLTQPRLLKELLCYIRNYPDLYFVHTIENIEPVLKYIFTAFELPRVLLQKLSILKRQFPEIYDKTLATCWMAMLLAKKLNYDNEQLQDIVLASLFQYLGLLHIEPKLVSENDVLTASELKTYQCYPLISRKIAEEISTFSNDMLNAIAQHKERGNGHGFPAKLLAHQLSESSQILSMANRIIELRMGQFIAKNKTLMDFAPYLKVNLRGHSPEVINAAHQILHRSGLPLFHQINRSNFISVCKTLAKANQTLIEIQATLKELISVLDQIQTPSKSVQRTILSLLNTFHRSGLSSSEAFHWLEQIQEEDFEDCLQDIAEQQHLGYWLRRGCLDLTIQLEKLLEKTDNETDKTTLNVFYQKLNQQISDLPEWFKNND
jgi:HD-GYP domain-containing protein (c-di-GMP phosphodiesterase class II)/succinate dehydrogenase flavin-adding protein (antitoxin of CptAB toxin-antitoxin module)